MLTQQQTLRSVLLGIRAVPMNHMLNACLGYATHIELTIHAKSHTGIFNRLTGFWHWLITDALQNDPSKFPGSGFEDSILRIRAYLDFLNVNCDKPEEWSSIELNLCLNMEDLLEQGRAFTFQNPELLIGPLNNIDPETAKEFQRLNAVSIIAHIALCSATAMRMVLANNPLILEDKGTINIAGMAQSAVQSWLSFFNTTPLSKLQEAIKPTAGVLQDSLGTQAFSQRCKKIIDQLCKLGLLRYVSRND